MQKNDLFEIEITDMGVDGEGIGHYEGMTFFIKDAVIGDVLLARVMKLKKNYGYARVEEIKTPSTFRVNPVCPQHRRCGGCQIQTLAYEKQLEFKQNKVRGNLIRIGGFEEKLVDRVMEPIVGMEVPYRYRNKAQLPVGTQKDGTPIVGFYAARTHSIIPVEDCMLGVEENKEILETIRTWMETYHISVYEEQSGKGLMRHILLRYGFTTKEMMVCLIINGTKLPRQQELIDALRQFAHVTSISININREQTNVILGEESRCIWGQPYITDYIHLRDVEHDFACTDRAIAYRISPQSFYQVNPKQTEKLYSTALEYAGLTGEESVWDLYCGIGTISLFLSQKAKKVYGVEIVPQAIADARENAKLNGITNVEFFVGEAEKVLPEFYKNAKENGNADDMLHPDVIVVDPPRKGCGQECLDVMLAMKPPRIVYVSCDSATLARDLKILCEGGYQIEKCRAVDQFGQTVHVETVVLLGNQKPDSYVELNIDMEEYRKFKSEN